MKLFARTCFSLLLTFSFIPAFGQCSIDTTLAAYQINPPVLPTACAGVPFTENVAWACPSDTLVFGFTVNIDSLIIDSVAPLPAGVTYVCDNPDCFYLGNSPDPIWGCLQVSGTAPTPGTYAVNIYYTGWVTILGNPTSLQLIATFTHTVNNCTTPNAAFTESINGLQVTFTDQSTDATAWSWDFGDGNSSTLPSPVHTYAQPGSYQVCLEVSHPLATDSTCKTLNLGGTGVEIADQNAVSIAPNPTAGPLRIHNEGRRIIRIQLMDLNGRILLVEENKRGFPAEFSWDLEQVDEGFYMLQVMDKKGRRTSRKVRIIR